MATRKGHTRKSTYKGAGTKWIRVKPTKVKTPKKRK
jgi:hypothetical protein